MRLTPSFLPTKKVSALEATWKYSTMAKWFVVKITDHNNLRKLFMSIKAYKSYGMSLLTNQ